MARERLLTTLGYDPSLLSSLSAHDRDGLRGAALSWLVVCLLLGLAAGYGGWLVQPHLPFAIATGLGVAVLAANLMRVVQAGGGVKMGKSPAESAAACRRYRPSLTPALVMVVLAALLSQPAQLPFWTDLEPEVEAHRQQLIDQHDAAATALGTDPRPYREQIEEAAFPIYRLGLLWKEPKRAAGWTAIFCLLVLLPAVWARFFAISSLRAYERARLRRRHALVSQLADEGRTKCSRLLRTWPTFDAEGAQ